MIKFVITLMVLFNMAWPVCTKISMPTDYSVVTNGSRANLKANFDETQTKVNPCMDSVDEVRARFTGYTGSFGVYSLENLLLRLDTDASTSAKLVVQNSNGDSLFRVAEDSSARVFGAFRAGGAVTLSNYTSGQVPYFGTGGLLTSGTGLTYNGSAFSVTGTGAFSGDFAINTNKFNITGSNGNTSIAGTIGVTGAAALDAQTTIKGAASSTSRPLILRTGLSSGGANNDYVDMLFRGMNNGSSVIDGGTIRCTFTDVTTRNAKIGIYGSLAEVQTLGLEVASNGAVTMPGTLAVTGTSTLTGAVTHGAGFIDKTTSLTSNTTLTTAHSTIFASASGGSFTITLPAASGNAGLTYTIYKTDVSAAATGGGNTVTIDGNGSETIGGALTQILASNTGIGIIKIICDGSNWKIQELYEEGTFTLTLTGCTTSPTATAYWIRNGNLVTVNKPDELSATSNTTSLSVTGIPVALRPATRSTTSTIGAIYDNSLEYTGVIQVGAVAGSFEPYFKTSLTSAHSGIYTSSGTKGLSSFNITYILK